MVFADQSFQRTVKVKRTSATAREGLQTRVLSQYTACLLSAHSAKDEKRARNEIAGGDLLDDYIVHRTWKYGIYFHVFRALFDVTVV